MDEQRLPPLVPTPGAERPRPGEPVRLPTTGELRDGIRRLRHDVRTPINHIAGYSEMVREEAADRQLDGLLPDLEQIQVAGRVVLDLVSDLLAEDRPVAGTPDPELLGRQLRAALETIARGSARLQEQAAALGHEDLVPDLRKIASAGRRLLELSDAVVDHARTSDLTAVGEPRHYDLSDPARGRETGPVGRPAPRLEADGALTPLGSLLVVDDNATNRDMLSRRLAREGYAVAAVANGRDALALLETQPVDLVLLDIMMPEMNGYQVLERLKADETLRHVPVIVLSSLDEIDSVVTCIELGAEDYLPKPFDSVLLRARIGASLEKKRLRDREVLYLRQIDEERRRSDHLLHVIFPHEIVEELRATNTVQPRRYDHVAVLFADIAGFTSYCDRHQPQEVLPKLQRLVEVCEDLVARFDMHKIKTVGDEFMATAGLLKPLENPVYHCVRCGVEMIAAARALPEQWELHVGIHVGPVVAGVLGRGQYSFDLWGDTVNTAARMEKLAAPGTIVLSEPAWREVATSCEGESLGRIQVKGKGDLEVFCFRQFLTPGGASPPALPEDERAPEECW